MVRRWMHQVGLLGGSWKAGQEAQEGLRESGGPAATKKRGEVPQAGAGGRARFRVKARRYKLLAEVIC